MEVDDVILTSIFTKCEKFDVSTYSFSKIHLQNKHQEIFEYILKPLKKTSCKGTNYSTLKNSHLARL